MITLFSINDTIVKRHRSCAASIMQLWRSSCIFNLGTHLRQSWRGPDAQGESRRRSLYTIRIIITV